MIISVALQKGGIGKSTTSQALACILGEKSKKALLIDMDPQGNTSFSSGIETAGQYTIYEVLMDECSIKKATYKTKYYDIIPSDARLTLATLLLKPDDTRLLNEKLDEIKNKYDYIIIDTPPSLGLFSLNALMASDYVVIPAEPTAYSLQGMTDFANTITAVKKENRKLRVLGILLIKYKNYVLHRQMRETMETYAKFMESKVFNSTIRECVYIGEAQLQQVPLIDYEIKKSKPIKDYRAFVKELLKEVK